MIRIAGVSAVLLLTLAACAEVITDLFEYGSIEVEAVRRNGDPVPGAELTLYSSFQVVAQAKTDENGHHLFDFIAPNQYGVHAEPPEGYLRPDNVLGGPSTAWVDGIVMEEGTESQASFTFLKIGPGRIEVSVREPDGEPIVGALVHAYSPGGEELGRDTVDGTGRVAFENVSFGNRGVWVMPPAIYLDFGEKPPFRHGLLVEEGSEVDVDFVLERCLGTIRGRVRDPDGEPVGNVSLRLYRPAEDVEVRETDADGESVFEGLRCHQYGLALVPSSGWVFGVGKGKSFYDGLWVNRDSDRAYEFTVRRCRAQIQVVVTDSASSPVEGANLEVYSASGSVARGATDKDGIRTFTDEDVPCNREFGVAVRPGVGYLVTEGRGSSFVDGSILGDGDRQDLAFTVARCTPEIRVRVEDGAGNSVPGAGLELYSARGSLSVGTTGDDGIFTFSRFPCGLEYGVKVQPPTGFTVTEGRGSSFFDGLFLNPDEILEVTFRLQASGG